MALSNNSISRNTSNKPNKRLSKSKVKAMVESYGERMKMQKEVDYVRNVIMSCNSLQQLEACHNMIKTLEKNYKGIVPEWTLEHATIGLNSAVHTISNNLPKPDPSLDFGAQY